MPPVKLKYPSEPPSPAPTGKKTPLNLDPRIRLYGGIQCVSNAYPMYALALQQTWQVWRILHYTACALYYIPVL